METATTQSNPRFPVLNSIKEGFKTAAHFAYLAKKVFLFMF